MLVYLFKVYLLRNSENNHIDDALKKRKLKKNFLQFTMGNIIVIDLY